MENITPTPESITVETDGHSFSFRMPRPRDFARMGARAMALRVQDEPTNGGAEQGLDLLDVNIYRGISLMQTLLERTDAKWVYTPGEDGKPVIDPDKFPLSATFVIANVYTAFLEQVGEFLGTPASTTPAA